MNSDRRVQINFGTSKEREEAADFLLSLVKTGLTFNAEQSRDTLVVTLTGGF